MRRDQKKRFARAAIVVAVLALAVGLTLVFAMAGGSSRASKGHMFASKLAARLIARKTVVGRALAANFPEALILPRAWLEEARIQALDVGLEEVRPLGEGFLDDRDPVRHDALAHRDQVRRGVDADLEAPRL